MKNPSHWDKSDLHKHLQHALDLELWTIPLYLTAVYSIRDLPKTKHGNFPDAAKLILSVVIQEMLHAEILWNLSNALGFSPKFHPPAYDESKGIPFIHPPKHSLPDELKGYTVKPQALGKESLKLFCAIEMPHPRKEIDWGKESRYNAQPELYEALRLGVASLWDTYYVGESNNRKQKSNFKEYHNEKGHGFSIIINSRDAALRAIEAIIEQGEGADSKNVPADFRPHQITDEVVLEAAWFKANLSHYQKFRILLHSYHKLPPVYKQEDTITEQAKSANENLRRNYANFWKVMEENFHTEGTEMTPGFWGSMWDLSNSIAAVWESGMCPDFNLDSH